MKQYVGEAHIIKSTNDMVYIGTDLPEEYAYSNYTNTLKGANAKAKANVAQWIPEMLMIADEREYENKKRNEYPFPARRPYSVTKPIS